MALTKPTHLDDVGVPDVVYNPLSNYRNVTYNTRLTMMPVTESKMSRPQRSYDYKNGYIMWETGGSGTTYLEELTIETVGTGNKTGNYAMQQHHLFSGKLVEPLGGRFIESLSLAAMASGYENNDGAVYLLEIMFKGYDSDSDTPVDCVGWSGEPMHFCYYVRIKTLKMKLDYKGSVYDFEMYPDLGAAAHSDHMNLEQGFRMDGHPSTIGDFCKQLEKALNKREAEKVSSGLREIPHQYTITAHKDIAGLKYEYSFFSEVTHLWGMRKGEIQVEAGTTIHAFIGNSLPNSQDVLKYLHRVNDGKKEYNNPDTKKGTINKPARHFSVICGAKNTGKYDKKLGGYAEDVHFFLTTKEDAKTVISPQEYKDATEQSQRDGRVNYWISKGLLRKVYKWIYTGENTEVINCDIKLDYLWRNVRPMWIDEDGKPVGPMSAARTAHEPPSGRSTGQTGKGQGPRGTQGTGNSGGGTSANFSNVGGKYAEDLPYRSSAPTNKFFPHMPRYYHMNITVNAKSEQAALNPENAMEYSIYKQLGNSMGGGEADMNTISLEVVGDPYWLMQVPGTPPWEDDVWEYEAGLTEEKLAEKRKKTASHNWLPFIYFEAVVPAADWSTDDLMNIRHSDTISGVYSAKKVVNRFSKGKFTTTLDCFRDNLSNPYGGKKSQSSSFTPASSGAASSKGPQNAGMNSNGGKP
jgi:hypothetical protein